jgi:hypothetical protein
LVDADFFVVALLLLPLDVDVAKDDNNFKHCLAMFNSFVEFSSNIMYSDGPNDHDAEATTSTMSADDEDNDDWNKRSRISFSSDDFSMSRRAF